MLIKIGNLEVANLLQYRKIAVVKNEIRVYLPYPSTGGSGISDGVIEGYPIHTFEKNIDANYALYNLFVTQNQGEKNMWDPGSVEPVSAIWDRLKQHFNDLNSLSWKLLNEAVITDFDLSKITITYNRALDGEFGENKIDNCKEVIDNYFLQMILGDSGFPLTFEWNAPEKMIWNA